MTRLHGRFFSFYKIKILNIEPYHLKPGAGLPLAVTRKLMSSPSLTVNLFNGLTNIGFTGTSFVISKEATKAV
jgi:hypothetical protein